MAIKSRIYRLLGRAVSAILAPVCISGRTSLSLIARVFGFSSIPFTESQSGIVSRRRDRFKDQVNNTEQRWCYADGLTDYLMEAVNGFITLPEAPFVGSFAGDTEAIDWALLWLPEGGELLTESYVNLIPTMQGGTHVNGLRQGCWMPCAISVNTAISCLAESSSRQMISGNAVLMCYR